MKKLALFLSFFCLSALVSWSAQDDQVIPLHVQDSNVQKERLHRGSYEMPFEAYYEEFSSSVRISFLQNVGTVAVYVTNVATGAYQEFSVNSCQGCAYLPICGASGLYFIELYLTDGQGFWGEFLI